MYDFYIKIRNKIIFFCFKGRRFYSLIVVIIFFILLIPPLAINTYLTYNELYTNQELKAADWQKEKKGIICISTGTVPNFKEYRINHKLKEHSINTMIFGASTSMGIAQDIMPQSYKIYNYSSNANPLNVSTAELESYSSNEDVKYYFFPFDLYPAVLTFYAMRGDSPTTVLIEKAPEVDYFKITEDALSSEKIRLLRKKVKKVLKSKNKSATFMELFMPYFSESYSCPDGSIARDFASSNPRTCSGFNDDGSSKFGFRSSGFVMDKIPEEKLEDLINFYGNCLKDINIKSQKNPVFETLSSVVNNLHQRRAKIIFYIPPAVPGLNKAIMKSNYKNDLLKIKAFLDAWAKENSVVILDATESEDFGCNAQEFLDAHHAFSSCYKKIWDRFFRVYPNIRPGLVKGSDL